MDSVGFRFFINKPAAIKAVEEEHGDKPLIWECGLNVTSVSYWESGQRAINIENAVLQGKSPDLEFYVQVFTPLGRFEYFGARAKIVYQALREYFEPRNPSEEWLKQTGAKYEMINGKAVIVDERAGSAPTNAPA